MLIHTEMSTKKISSRQNQSSKRNGFTLIELMVVISIISLLSSIIFASVNVARAKARDARKIAEIDSVRSALSLYYSTNLKMPTMYTCNSLPCTADNTRNTLEIEDQTNPTNPSTESGKAYLATMNDLVNSHYLASVPKTLSGSSYAYYNYGSSNQFGAMFGTSFEVSKAKVSAGSCTFQVTDPKKFSCLVNSVTPNIIVNCWSMCLFYTDTTGNPYAGGPGNTGVNPSADPSTYYDGDGGGECIQVVSLCDPSNKNDFCSCNPF